MLSDRIRRHLLPGLLLLAGLALRIWFILHHALISGDALLYADIARNWFQHHTYGLTIDTGIQPTLIRLPGYPLFLGLCFTLFGYTNFTAVLVLQAIADLATCVLIASLAGRLFGARASILALAIGALCPFTANYTATPLAETLTLFTTALALFSFERWQTTFFTAGRPFNKWLYLTAAALSYSLFLRPDQALLTAAIIPAMLASTYRNGSRIAPKAAAPALLCLALTLSPLIPWTIRNARTLHVFQPLAPRYATDPGEAVPLGFYRWFRTWGIDFAGTEDAYWKYPDEPINIADLPNRAFDSDEEYIRTAEILANSNQHPGLDSTIDADFGNLAASRIANDPLRYWIELPIARVGNMLLRPRTETFSIDLEWWKYRQHRADTILASALAALNLAYLLAAAAGLYRLWRSRVPAHITILAATAAAYIIMRCLMLLTIDNSEPRYTLEFFPVLILFAAILANKKSVTTET